MRTIVLIVLVFSIGAEARTRFSDPEDLFLRPTEPAALQRKPMLTGILSEDLFAPDPAINVKDSLTRVDNVETRSALKAGLFSFLIPGAGQAYNHDYWLGAGFLALEAAAWAVDFIWTTKANNVKKEYMTYADGTAADNYQNAHYSVVRYAQWIKSNLTQLEEYNGTSSQGQQAISKVVGLLLPDKINPDEAPWLQVNWYALNTIEANMGGYFAHQLFPHPNFEYYELIGKYPQFRQGWVDSPWALWLQNGKQGPPPIAYNRADTPDSYYYMNRRGYDNNLYRVATTALEVVIVNHFASAIEAAVAAHIFDQHIHAHVSMSALPMEMGYQANLQLAVNF